MPLKKWLAALLNFIWPPFGYFYTGHLKRFMVFLIVPPLLVLGSLFFISRMPPSWIGPLMAFVLCSALALYAGLPIDAYLCAKTPQNHQLLRKPSLYWSLPLFLLVSLLTEFTLPLLRPYMADARNIPSASMMPNLLPGDYVFVSALRAPARRGELIAFHPPFEEEKLFIKRLVGMPGDRIEMREENVRAGSAHAIVLRLRINGRDLPLQFKSIYADGCGMDECFVFTEGAPGEEREILETPLQAPAETESIVLGEDEFFLLGDNRDDSRDSRYIGPIARKSLHSRYVYTYASFEPPKCNQLEEEVRPECRATHGDSVSVVDTLMRLLSSSVRWNRFGLIVH